MKWVFIENFGNVFIIGEMKQQNSDFYSTGFDFNNTTFFVLFSELCL